MLFSSSQVIILSWFTASCAIFSYILKLNHSYHIDKDDEYVWCLLKIK